MLKNFRKLRDGLNFGFFAKVSDWVHEHYGKKYAPNTLETFRRQTMHQFYDAGVVIYNPDKPDRPVDSPKAVYQIEPTA